MAEKPKYYEDLLVFKKADDLAYQVYLSSSSFPKTEIYGLTSQLRRAIVSVPANIIEGSLRKGNKEFCQFLYISLASLGEASYYLKFALRLGYIKEDEAATLLDRAEEVGKMTRGLIRSLAITKN